MAMTTMRAKVRATRRTTRILGGTSKLDNFEADPIEISTESNQIE
jgi:hypothetical protein